MSKTAEYDAETEQIIPEKYLLEEKYILIRHYSGKCAVKVNLDTIAPLTPMIITKGKILAEGLHHAFEIHCPALVELSGVVSEENLKKVLPKTFGKLEKMARNGNLGNVQLDENPLRE